MVCWGIYNSSKVSLFNEPFIQMHNGWQIGRPQVVYERFARDSSLSQLTCWKLPSYDKLLTVFYRRHEAIPGMSLDFRYTRTGQITKLYPD